MLRPLEDESCLQNPASVASSRRRHMVNHTLTAFSSLRVPHQRTWGSERACAPALSLGTPIPGSLSAFARETTRSSSDLELRAGLQLSLSNPHEQGVTRPVAEAPLISDIWATPHG